MTAKLRNCWINNYSLMHSFSLFPSLEYRYCFGFHFSKILCRPSFSLSRTLNYKAFLKNVSLKLLILRVNKFYKGKELFYISSVVLFSENYQKMEELFY